MAEVIDPAFVPLRSGTQFCVWRIQKLKLVAVTERDRGKFYSGDCYLVFDGRHGGQHIYYWIGRDSTIDEQTVAAIKAVELDNMFNGMAVQHREVMGYESQTFKKLFPEGVITLLGGADSGLTKVTHKQHVAKLFQVMGGKVPLLREVGLDWSNMNHGDTFVLDAGSLIFIWRGESSSPEEKISAAGLATRLRDRLGEDIVHLADGAEEDDLTEDELQTWIKHLPLERRGEVTPAVSDRKISSIVQSEIALYRCSDSSGELNTHLVKTGNLSRDLLHSQDSFIIDALSLGIWIWLGRTSNNSERNMAIKTGIKFIGEKQLCKNTKITKVFMDGEPEEFKSLFVNWN